MEDYLVVETERTKNGLIVHKVDTGETEPKAFKWSAIRAGFSWPTPASPGFYILVGEEFLDEFRYEGSKKRGKLKVFVEKNCQGLFLDDLFEDLTDACALYCCDPIYADLNEEHEEEAEFFREFTYSKHIALGRLEKAPYKDNFSLGVSIIKRWVKDDLLVLPEDGLVRKELKGLTTDDLANAPEIRFPGINALRYVIAAFDKFKRSGRRFKPNRSKKSKRK